MHKRNLICIVGELRGAELTFQGFKEKVLDPNDADLLLCVQKGEGGGVHNEYYNHAKYIKEYDTEKNITEWYERISRRINGSSNWKRLLHVQGHWLGGVKDTRLQTLLSGYKDIRIQKNISQKEKLSIIFRMFCNGLINRKGPFDQGGGGGYVFLYKYLLLHMLVDKGLDRQYERFIVTRSDQFYAAYHPIVEKLDPNYVWIPEGEDYKGYCDRHWVLSQQHVTMCLDLLRPIFIEPDELLHKMKDRYDWNSEGYVQLIWDERGVQVKRFPRTQFLVRGNNKTPVWSKGEYNEHYDMTIAYPSEYKAAQLNVSRFSSIDAWNRWTG